MDTACAGRRTFHDDEMDFGAVRVVAVMLPLANLTRDNMAGEIASAMPANMLPASGAGTSCPRAVMRHHEGGGRDPRGAVGRGVGEARPGLEGGRDHHGRRREYGEVWSGTTTANVVREHSDDRDGDGRVVWSAVHQGRITVTARLFGGGGQPVNHVTEEASVTSAPAPLAGALGRRDRRRGARDHGLLRRAGAAQGAGADGRVRVALLPLENLEPARPLATNDAMLAIERAVARAGVGVSGDPVEEFLASRRIRNTGGIDGETAKAVEELEVDGVVLTSVGLYAAEVRRR